VSYTAGNGSWQNLLLDRIDANHFLIKWQANQNYCVHIPNGANNVQLKLTTCNASDTTQRFNIYTTGGLPNYVTPVNNGFQGVLQSEYGQRLTIPGVNSSVGLAYPNNNDPAQQIQFIQSGNSYLFQRVGSSISLSSNTLDYVNNNQNGLAMTTYTTGAGRWQNFGFIDAGNGYYNIKWQSNPAYCVSAGIANGGSGVGVIVPCVGWDLRQRFKPTGSNVTTQDISTPYYYAVIASGGSVTPSSISQTGHTWSGVFKVIKNETLTYTNGVLSARSTTGYGYEKTTVSAWEGFSPVPIISKLEDIDWLTKYINGNPNSGFTYRLKAITAQVYANAISTYSGQTGCVGYEILRTSLTEKTCNCTRASVNFWNLVANETVTGVMTPGVVQ
jgi:hypothetical protein